MAKRVQAADRATTQELQRVLHAAASALGWEGLAVLGTSASFDPEGGEISVKLKFRVEGEGQADRAFAQGAKLMGIKPEARGAVLKINGEDYRLTGWQLRRSKYPVVVERVRDGKATCFVDSVLDKLPADLKTWRSAPLPTANVWVRR